jgi:hypothetical protein
MHGLTGGGWKRGATTVDAKDPGGETPGVSAKTYRRATPPRQSSTLLRPGSSSVTFSYLSQYLWHTVWRWLRRKHRRSTWKELRRDYCRGGWWPSGQDLELFDPEKVGTTRYRYRGSIIPTPWPIPGPLVGDAHPVRAGLVESPVH